VCVGATTLEHDLNVVLVLSQIGRVLLHCDHSTSLLERIVGVTFGLIELDTFVLVESLGEIISINNTENSAIDIEV
jgi:hypothetical protein